MLCVECGKREARFLAPNGQWKSDRQHNLCPQCYREQRDHDRAPQEEAEPSEPARHPWPTASYLELAHECVHPWALPGIHWHDREIGEAALGSAFHDYAQRHVNRWSFSTDDLAQRYGLDEAQHATLMRMIQGFRPVFGAGAEAEVAFAYDVTSDSSRELPRGRYGHRDYSLAEPGEFVGTADLVWVYSRTAFVRDWKCGQRAYVRPPRENRQLRFLALCAARAMGAERAQVEIGWVGEDGRVDIDSATFDAFDLAAIAGEMAELADRLRSPTPEPPLPGTHCQWCPAVGDCEASRQAMEQIAPGAQPFRVVATAREITGPEHATWLLHRWRAVKAAVEVVEAALQQYADRNGGIGVGDGSTWRRHEVQVERIHLTEETRKLLEDALPGSTFVGATKRSIMEAARAAGLPLERTKDAAMSLLRTAGVVRSKVMVRYEDR